MSQAETEYDVVIVGAGVSGALAASALTRQGYRVVILESGPPLGYADGHVSKFYAADIKTPDAPWPGHQPADTPENEYAPRTTVLDMGARGDVKDAQGNVLQHAYTWDGWYLLQTGPYPFNSTYERLGGGTSNHWLGTCLRHVPNDFRLKSKYGAAKVKGQDGKPLLAHARDWPIGYDDLEPWYLKAEREIGVAGDSETFSDFLGAKRSKPFPMTEIPQTYLDQRLAARVDGMDVNDVKVSVQSTPQGRNSREYPTKKDAAAFGLFAGGRFTRYRCLGNTSCIPICPIQAKWDANAALRQATSPLRDPAFPKKTRAEVRYRSVAYRVCVADNDSIASIKYYDYSDPDNVRDLQVSGRIYVLAAHAIETPKLLLLSPWKDGKTVANSSDQVGRNIMDHVIQSSFGLADEPLYPFRAPLSTSGIGEFRDTPKRDRRAAYRIEIHNDGWAWPDGAPGKTVWEIMNLDNVDALERKGDDVRGIKLINAFFKRRPELKGGGKWYGKDLRQQLEAVVTRQISIAGEPEALPLPDARVTLAPEGVTDKLGIRRPSVHYDISEYTMAGFAESATTLTRVLESIGVVEIDHTLMPLANAAAQFTYKGETYNYGGAGHIAGTYRMGDDPADAVLDKDCRAHDHPNLFMLGSGVFPSLGTGNPTLTIAALALRAADTIAGDLRQGGDP